MSGPVARFRRLEKGREEAHERLGEALLAGTLEPAGGHQPFAVAHIVQKYLFHPEGERFLIDESVDLEIVLETTEIHIGRSDADQGIVADDKLSV